MAQGRDLDAMIGAEAVALARLTGAAFGRRQSGPERSSTDGDDERRKEGADDGDIGNSVCRHDENLLPEENELRTEVFALIRIKTGRDAGFQKTRSKAVASEARTRAAAAVGSGIGRTRLN